MGRHVAITPQVLPSWRLSVFCRERSSPASTDGRNATSLTLQSDLRLEVSHSYVAPVQFSMFCCGCFVVDGVWTLTFHKSGYGIGRLEIDSPDGGEVVELGPDRTVALQGEPAGRLAGSRDSTMLTVKWLVLTPVLTPVSSPVVL